MQILLNAIGRARLNRGRIRDALTGIESYKGVTGDMVFDPNCKNIAPLFLGQCTTKRSNTGASPSKSHMTGSVKMAFNMRVRKCQTRLPDLERSASSVHTPTNSSVHRKSFTG